MNGSPLTPGSCPFRVQFRRSWPLRNIFMHRNIGKMERAVRQQICADMTRVDGQTYQA